MHRNLHKLGGSPKVGKSWMALQLCLAVCGGTAFLGRKAVQAEVLYLALEDGPQRLHSRALRLADTAPSGLHLCHRAAPIGQGLEQQIEAQLAKHPHIRLVVLDTLQKVRCVGGSGLSYGSDYGDAGLLKALADRNGICLLVVHHLRKMADDDPFNRLSGTNGLAGAADGTLILMRGKRQDGTATLYATGRDIEDVEEELEFADCQWSRAVPPEQLQLTLVVNALQKLLAEGEFRGTATELAARLETQGSYWSPAILSKYLQSHDDALARCGILLETKRTSSKRLLHLQYDAQACDTSDGSDGCDRESPAGGMLSLPSQPSLHHKSKSKGGAAWPTFNSAEKENTKLQLVMDTKPTAKSGCRHELLTCPTRCRSGASGSMSWPRRSDWKNASAPALTRARTPDLKITPTTG